MNETEMLAIFAKGVVKRSEMPAALEAKTRLKGGIALTVAAAALLILASGLLIVQRHAADPLRRLIALAPRSARAVEPRLTGGFAWAPYRGPMREEPSATDPAQLRLAGAAGEAVARAGSDPASGAQHSAGIALLLIEKPGEAATRLRAATERAPDDARGWSDYAAALDDEAIRAQRPSLHAEALPAADHALRIDASLPEALFNRALILEHLGLTAESGKSWEQYLRIDPSSPWAAEAREHLKGLPVADSENRFREEQPRLERAALAGDMRAVDELVSRYPQQSRTFAEVEYLGRWGENGSNDALTIARAIGDALRRISGESLLHDAGQAIDGGDAARRARIASAHAVYRRARIAYSKQQPAAAQPELRRAAALFAEDGDPMSLVARYYAASARYDGEDVAGARAELLSLAAETNAHHLALAAQIRWELALTYIADADWTAALATLTESESLFQTLGERSNLGFIEGLQATSLSCLGRTDEAWAARIRSLRVLEAEGRGDLLAVSLGGATRAELLAGRLQTARALLEIEVAANRDARAPVLLTNALVRLTLVNTRLGDDDAASQSARELLAVAHSVSDPSLRGPVLAGANVAAGAAALHGDPREASRLLTSAIDFYARSERRLFLPEARLLRARAALRLGDRAAAARDLEDGWNEVVRHRVRIAGAVSSTDVLDASAALAVEAIRLRLDSGDLAGAFDWMERRNRQITGDENAVTIRELQQRLRGSGTAVLMLTMLPSEAAIVCVEENDVVQARVPLDGRTLAVRIAGATTGTSDASALYDALLRPVAPALARARRVVIVADASLQQVPFAALYDSSAKRYLVETMEVAVAASASALRTNESNARPHSVLGVALPSGSMAALPDAERELTDVCAFYPRSVTIDPQSATLSAVGDAARTAGVIHIAGHTASGADDLALQFSSSRTGMHRVSWRDLAALHLLPSAVVVVAGCETLRGPDAGRTRGLSLGGGFLAAGAADVIGTLVPIADRDARDFFRDLHRHIAGGASAGDALREAQRAAIRSESSTGRRTAWRAVALLTSHV
jgi:hypothetical protein